MKNRLLVVFLSFLSFSLYAQDTIQDNLIFRRDFYSTTSLRPVNIPKGEMFFSLNAAFPKYFKVYNPQSASIDKISPKVVYNEMNLCLTSIYAITSKLNIIAYIPFSDHHYYTPVMYLKGIGLGDIRLAVNYNFLNNEKSSMSALLEVGVPTGKNQNLSAGELPLGSGAFIGKAEFSGLKDFEKWQLIYSLAYEYYSVNSAGIDVPDLIHTSVFAQKTYRTNYGNFGVEGGTQIFAQPSSAFSNTINADLFAGAYYAYTNNFNIHIAFPYTIYQNTVFLTKYNMVVQLDYKLKRKK